MSEVNTLVETSELTDEQLVKAEFHKSTGKWTAINGKTPNGEINIVNLDDDQIKRSEILKAERSERQSAKSEIAKIGALELESYLDSKNKVDTMALKLLSGLLNDQRRDLKFKDIPDDDKIAFRYFGVVAGNVLPDIPALMRQLEDRMNVLAKAVQDASSTPVAIDGFCNTAQVAMDVTGFRMSAAQRNVTIKASLSRLRKEREEEGLDKKAQPGKAANWTPAKDAE